MTIEQLKQLVEKIKTDGASVTTDDLDSARDAIRTHVAESKDQPASEENIALLTELVAAKSAVDAETQTRADADAAQAAKAAELIGELERETEPAAAEDTAAADGGEQAEDTENDDPAPAAENEDTVTEQDTAPELVTASAIADAVTKGIQAAFAAHSAEPDAPKGRVGRPSATTTAPAAGGDVVQANVFVGANPDGRKVTSTREAAEALHKLFTGPYQAPNFSGRMPVLHVQSAYPDSRMLTNDTESNFDKIEKVTSRSALVAGGGLCAPLETLYDVEVIGSADRPVRDALARFGVDRGGITYRPPVSAATAVYGAGVWTVDDDAADPLGTKATYVVDCGAPVEAEIEAIYLSLEFGNISTRFDPETTAANVEQGLIAHARLAENRLLAKLAAGSKALSGAKVVGATRDILVNIDKATAYYRNRHRISDAVALTMIQPGWVKSLMRADIARQMASGDWVEALALADSQIDKWFTARGVSPVWHLDGPTGLNEVQTVTITGTPTGGTYTLSYSGQTTSAIAYNAGPSQVEAALSALSNLKDEDITVTGSAGGPFTVTFGGGVAAGANVAQMTATGSLTGGSSPAVAVATTTGGGGALTVNGISVASQTYADAAAGSAIPGFPDQIDSVLFPSGSWLFLDGGSLDLGLVRDSTLNARNRYRQFSETFEGAAFKGVESMRLIMTVQPTGQTAGTKDTDTSVTD